MIGFRILTLAAVAAILCTATTAKSQVQAEVTIGVAPECPYGYYDYAPYNCVPDGYYGPEWFNGGVFIGVGPWFHGPGDFQGKVDNSYDPQHGFSGDLPKRGDKVSATHKSAADFKGNEARDGRGHIAPNKH
jgi:hypothetical protein